MSGQTDQLADLSTLERAARPVPCNMYCPAGIYVVVQKCIDASARLTTFDRYRPRPIEPFAQRPRQLGVVTHNKRKIPYRVSDRCIEYRR